MRWAEDAKALFEQGIPFVLATLIECDGSAPREAGAKMIIPQEGAPLGTIGGGVLEAAVIGAAQNLFSKGGSEIFDYRYPHGGCGGWVRVFLESIAPRRKLVIFGGGHIGHALATVMAPTTFQVRVIEERAETLEKFRWPEGVELMGAALDEAVETLRGETNLYCVIAGFSARQDLQILSELAHLPWHYLGVLGSRGKGERLREHLRQIGIGEERIGRFHCPAGLKGVGGKEPSEIAVSIAAEILSR